MVYLHILGSGPSKSAIANSKGHLFEHLVRALLDSLNMVPTRMNKRISGLEIDIEGKTTVGNVSFYAECKAKDDALDSPDIQQFGFKFYLNREEDLHVTGILFTLSPLNTTAQELWDRLVEKHGDRLACYDEEQIVSLLIEHYRLASPELIRRDATQKYFRACGDTQLLCVEGNNNQPELFWAQLLMSSDGTEPSHVVFFAANGTFITEQSVVERLLSQKPDLKVPTLTCLNLQSSSQPVEIDDIPPARKVVRVRMSSGWFDYRFPAAPPFFVGRSTQRSELTRLIRDIREGKTSTRGILFSGKSGIGKSSLALKARDELMKEDVVFLPIDSRLCDDVTFLFDSVNELLFELRQIPEIKPFLATVRVRGLDSLIDTLIEIHEAIAKEGYLAVLFFDQFEKVFEYPEVTRAIRNIFLRVTEKQLAILFGFSWKSDLWSLAEGFPHNEKDDIVRESYAVKQLIQFGQEETSEILKQLETHWNGKLSKLLRRQIENFSRGLPWLLKKVCAHILVQKEQGVTDNELIETNLKLQDLFEADLAGLDDEERSLLRAIAPLLPATLQRVSESFEISNIDQSLHRFIDYRILVKITEDMPDRPGGVKYDAYSDIFREFLITGRVSIEEAYYFFTYPKGALKFFEKVQQRGALSIDEEIQETGKQIISIYNLSRDLRSLGLINVRDKVFTATSEAKHLRKDDIVSFLQNQLKRNRVVSLTLSELNENESVPLSRIAELLQELFPSVQAQESTWEYYSRTMASWLYKARLALYDKRSHTLHRVDDEAVFESILERESLISRGYRLPLCFRNSILGCLECMYTIGGKATIPQLMEWLRLSHQSVEKVLSDTLNLKFVSLEEKGPYYLTDLGNKFVESSDRDRRQIFRQQCLKIKAFELFVTQIAEAGEDGISGKSAAFALAQQMLFDLADATIDKLGSILANWAEYAEIIVRSGGLCYMTNYAPQMRLFD